LLSNATIAQSKKNACHCPQAQKVVDADIRFQFTNGTKIGLCGEMETEEGLQLFSEFVLFECGKKQSIGDWKKEAEYIIEVKRDTLFVVEMESLPTGDNFEFEYNRWMIEKLWFNGKKWLRKKELNLRFHRFDQAEIDNVLEEYEENIHRAPDAGSDMPAKLFVAAVSGNEKARSYLLSVLKGQTIQEGGPDQKADGFLDLLNQWDKANAARNEKK